MPRKLRLEYPGACYHVINRGNYRADVFASEKTKAAFESCLFEACGKAHWRLHAFVVMRTHFHLAVETPEGNLVTGMHWLSATFAIRFNRLRDERGHLFQGRYKALIVEPGESLGRVCHYIHLNPVRAGVTSAESLGSYRFSSYWYLTRPRVRPAFLEFRTALREAGLFADSPAGWKNYAGYLAIRAGERADDDPVQSRLSQDWALGSPEFKQALIRDHQLRATTRAWGDKGARQFKEESCHHALRIALPARGKTPADLARDRKCAPWKVALAAELKKNTLASNAWLAQHLHMGRPDALSSHISKYRKSHGR